MVMTEEQMESYNKLGKIQQGYFDEYVEEYPNTTFEEAIRVASVCATAGKKGPEIARKGGNPEEELKKNSVQKEILERAAKYIRDVLPKVWENVKNAFSSAISTLTNAIRNGIEYVRDIVDDAIDWVCDLFS